MSDLEKYKLKYSFAEDYGTSYYKFGPVGEKPDVIENRGVILDKISIVSKIMGIEKNVIVGPEVATYIGHREAIGKHLIYPMRDGLVEKEDERSWKIIHEITKYGLVKYRPSSSDFKGFYVAAALSAIAPEYMYRKIFEIHQKIDEETGLVKAVTIIPQPLAVAIAEKSITCIVVESGHGNTQITPISRYPIREAVLSLNRGGAEADAITAEIMKDCGYGDLAREEKLIRCVKESIGLIPIDLRTSIEKAKKDPERFRAMFRIPNTTITIDLEENSWMRFLIGEIIFNPENELFESFYKRGMPRPKDTLVGDTRVPGTVDLARAIVMSAERTSFEVQMYLYRKIILSGGNFSWKVPKGLEDAATDAATKITNMLKKYNIEAKVELTKDPMYSVWKGAIVYAIAVPDEYEWSWESMEGWYKWR